jgi:V-type H+-transporting ATPase subunit E
MEKHLVLREHKMATQDRQIKQMIAFINQEALEKAEEIRQQIDKAQEAVFLNLKGEMVSKIIEQHETKKKDLLTKRRIERSKHVNASRMAGMRARNDKLKEVKDELRTKMATISSNPKYPELVKFLLVEGFMTIMEQDVTVLCREEDRAVVEAQLKPAIATFKKTMKDACGREPVISAKIDKKEPLPPAPVEGQQGVSCCGGVVLYAKNKKIICRNTLDSRAQISFQKLLPEVRGLLFGIRAPPEVKVVA